jgi:type II secretory pathway pseudopilin PulG
MKKNKLLNKKGFTIVETLITLLAITIMIAGPLTFMYKSFSYAEFVKTKVIATSLSQEGLELATSLRNADLATFISSADACSSGCNVDWDGVSTKPVFTSCTDTSCELHKTTGDDTNFYKVSGDTGTGFFRQIVFTPNGTQGYMVESKVWSYVGGVKVEVVLKKVFLKLVIK